MMLRASQPTFRAVARSGRDNLRNAARTFAPRGRVVARVAQSPLAKDASGGTHAEPASRQQAAASTSAAATSSEDEHDGSGGMMANLLLQCKDQKGVIAAVAQLLFGFGCNIVSSDQFSDVDAGIFFQRITFDYRDVVVGKGNMVVLERAIAELARRFDMSWRVSYSNKLKRVAILVSKMDHCLYDILIRHRSKELRCEIPVIVSNHQDLRPVADMFGVEFAYLPLNADKSNKREQEQQIEALLEKHEVDVVVLARYMQIFSSEYCNRNWHRTINIHHSFLPAFEGARPYHRAHERGVKIIGATAHFATAELDAGPIIDQGVVRITHRDSVADMIRKGRDLERLVLAKALRWHLDDRVMVHGNKTVVFED